MFSKLLNWFSHDIAIDLGTANVLVYAEGQGIVVNEPSVIALNQKTGQVVAVGNEAQRMIGRTPQHVSVIRPLTEGVISDFEVAEEMLGYFIKKIHDPKIAIFARPKIVVGVPSGITDVERRAVRDACRNAGASEVYLIEEPMAAAIGARLPIQDPVGSFIIDIGGGTTDIAAISLGGIVSSINLKVAGDVFNNDIINYARDEFKLLLGERTAEDVKIAIGSVLEKKEKRESTIRGRDLVSGLPREVVMTDKDIRNAISKSVQSIIGATKEVIEMTPPELISDIMHRGILLVGGGVLLDGMAELISKETKIPARISEDPKTAVVRGCGIVLESLGSYKNILIEHEDEESPK